MERKRNLRHAYDKYEHILLIYVQFLYYPSIYKWPWTLKCCTAPFFLSPWQKSVLPQVTVLLIFTILCVAAFPSCFFFYTFHKSCVSLFFDLSKDFCLSPFKQSGIMAQVSKSAYAWVTNYCQCYIGQYSSCSSPIDIIPGVLLMGQLTFHWRNPSFPLQYLTQLEL